MADEQITQNQIIPPAATPPAREPAPHVEPEVPVARSRRSGGERTRRRTAQAVHAAQAKAEGEQLASPDTDAKFEQIEKNKQLALQVNGPTAKTRREGQQARHRAAAKEQDAAAGQTTVGIGGFALVPGEQVSLLTANRMARKHDRDEFDITTETARAVAVVVRDKLRGGLPEDAPEISARSRAQHNARADVIARQAAAAVTNAK